MRYLTHTFVGASMMAIVAVGAVSVTEKKSEASIEATLGAIDALGVRTADTCGGGMDVDYMEALRNGSTDVQFAGCGGLL